MQRVKLVIIFFLFHSYSFSQIVGFEKKDTLRPFLWLHSSTEPKIILGTEQETTIAVWKDKLNFKRNYIAIQTWEPHLGYYLFKNLGFGLTGKIEFFTSNFMPNNTPNVYELGVFGRYFIPFQFNVKVFNRLSFSTTLSYSKANYSRKGEDVYYIGTDSSYLMFDGLKQGLVRMSLNCQFRIWKGLNFKISNRYEMFLNNYYKFRPTVGLEYHFYNEEKKKKKI